MDWIIFAAIALAVGYALGLRETPAAQLATKQAVRSLSGGGCGSRADAMTATPANKELARLLCQLSEALSCARYLGLDDLPGPKYRWAELVDRARNAASLLDPETQLAAV